MKYFRIKNWDKFQHYKHRNPPWVKLHISLLQDPIWVMLDDASRLLAIVCIMLASQRDGQVAAEGDYIRKVAYLDADPDFSHLVNYGFLVPCWDVQADASKCLQDASQRRAEESRGEERQRRDRGRVDNSMSGTNKKSPAPYEPIIAYLNQEAGTNFDHKAKATRTLIKGRWDEGKTLDDFKRVVDLKVADWKHDGEMRQYLRPATLFNATKMESYLGSLTTMSTVGAWIPPEER